MNATPELIISRLLTHRFGDESWSTLVDALSDVTDPEIDCALYTDDQVQALIATAGAL